MMTGRDEVSSFSAYNRNFIFWINDLLTKLGTCANTLTTYT